ncbi:MAG: hypothetical protein NTX42_04190 [Methanothrix sp.]|nr:hypothetical protein [Methanothrix sp.]
MKIKPWIGCSRRLLQLALLAMLLLATGQGALVKVGSYNTPGFATGVALSGSYAYVADCDSGLKIIDVSNPTSPLLKGSYDTPGYAYGVALSGSYAYVADGDSGLQIIDVSNPASPLLKGSYDTPGYAYGVALSGSYAYVADSYSGLKIIDVSNPDSPLLKGSYDTPGYAYGVALSGSYAYVADSDSGLQILAEGATLQGKAWQDLNYDGRQDAGELGLANVAVQLLDSSASPIAGKSATTGSDGSYSFPDLVPGDYYVQFTQPTGKTFSPKDQGTDDSLDSDVNQTTGRTDVITVTAGQNSLHWDAGLFQPHLSISGNKTTDKGAAVSGWKINLTGTATGGSAVLNNTTTGSDGSYNFTDLQPGSYTVSEQSKSGWEPAGQASQSFDLVASRQDVNFVNRVLSDLTISGKKTNETGIAKAGWKITLTGATLEGGAVSKEATTASDGSYSFNGLLAGSYNVTEESKPGWVPVGAASQTFDLFASRSDVNFVNRALSGLSISGKKTNETGAAKAGWKITLTGANLEGGAVSEEATTASDGGYSFTGLLAGSYTISEESKPGWEPVGAASQTFDLVTSRNDVNFVNRVVSSLTISGKKTNETGAAKSGWKITLTGANLEGGAVSQETTTASDGGYSFTGLLAGSYTVTEESKPGWEPVGAASQTFDLFASRSDVNFVNRVLSGLSISGKKTNETGAAKADWKITLSGANLEGGAVSQETTTASDGGYSFTGLLAGSYTVTEESKPGWEPVGAAGQSFDLFASRSDVDFVNRVVSSLSISGGKTTDKDVPKSGWGVNLTGTTLEGGAVSQETTTASDGSYSFTGLLAGSYTVTEESRLDWEPVGAASQSFDLFASRSDVNFVNRLAALLSGLKFEDKDGNGLQGTGEGGLPGWTIKLQKLDGSVITTTTDADGNYSFPDLPEGSYIVSEELQDGWRQTAPASGSYSVDLQETGASALDFANRKNVTAMNVTMTAHPTVVLQGNLVTLTTIVNGQGDILPDSLDAVQTLPKGLKFVFATPPPQVSENQDGTTTLSWTGLAAGSGPLAELGVQATVEPDASGELTSSVLFTGSSSQAFIASARAEASVTVQNQNLPVYLNKTSDLKEVWPGGTVGYTITYISQVGIPLTNVTITEQASSDLIFLSATPAPDAGTENVWSIGLLPSQGKGTIMVLFQVKNASNLSFESQSSVSGSGFVNNYRRLSTETEIGGLKNSVTLTCDQFTPVSTSYFVKLRDSEGTSLLKNEHGSGEYRSEEATALHMQNRSISTEGSLNAVYRPTSFSLPGDKSINYDSEISSLTRTRNRATQASTSQEIRYAKSLEMDEKLLVDKNETLISVEGALKGQAHLGVLKKDGETVKPSPIFESSQDYAGTFHFNQSLQDYGGNVRMIRNVTGLGQAASDQRLKKSQRSFEHGFGSYQSEELVSTAESYIGKELSVSSDPAYGYGKWKAGIWSKSSGNSYLGQEISGADYIREETKAAGLSDMSTNLSFLGKARLRAISQQGNRSQMELDEEYVGRYAIKRTVHLGGVSRFDRPHLTLNKTGHLIDRTTMVDYQITVLNDGNAALGPVYVWDIFPAGTDYLGSSQKPDRLQPGYANWSLLYLSIGQSVNINLRLNVTDQQDELVNVVYASGGHNGEWVSAGNMSVMQFGWLSCCQPEMLVEKQARTDAVDNRLIWYRILLKNQANVSLVAQVTDRLPVGLKILNASAEPQVQGQNLIWVTAAIPAGESRFIEYLAKATSNGKFVNTARIEAHARDGSGGATAEASATVTVGEATSYAEDGWRPPEWGLDRSEMICDEGIAGEGASCATGGCPV